MSKAKEKEQTKVDQNPDGDREVDQNFQASTNGGEAAGNAAAGNGSGQLPDTVDPKPISNDASNPFSEIGASAPRRIVGELLKFSKGDWLYGRDNDELPRGTKMIANMNQLLTGWIRWEDNKPADQLMGLVSDGFKPAKRDTLAHGYTPGCKQEDVDTSEWEVDATTGVPRDPWQKTFYLLMRGFDDEGVNPLQGDEGLYTFTTSSKGGTDAIVDLCAKYGKWMRMRKEQFPVVTLDADKYPHPNKQLGIIKTPKLLFNPKKDWVPIAAFGEISDAAMSESEGEQIPF